MQRAAKEDVDNIHGNQRDDDDDHGEDLIQKDGDGSQRLQRGVKQVLSRGGAGQEMGNLTCVGCEASEGEKGGGEGLAHVGVGVEGGVLGGLDEILRGQIIHRAERGVETLGCEGLFRPGSEHVFCCLAQRRQRHNRHRAVSHGPLALEVKCCSSRNLW